MQEIARVAGFFAAHGVWSVSDGAALTPMLGFERADGERGMTRFAIDDVGYAAQVGRAAMAANEHNAERAALVVDASVEVESGQVDALIVEAVEYGPAGRSLTVAVPYRPLASLGGFAVHRPKFLEISGADPQDTAALGEAFFAGVDAHARAAAVWNAHLDESV